VPVRRDIPTKTRAVIVGGVRTPFVRAFGAFIALDSIALGTVAVKALLKQTKVPVGAVDGVIWGGVILPGSAANIGREIALDAGLPRCIEAHTVTRACTSGLLAVTQAVAAIERGEASVMIAGGSDSTSNTEVKMPQSFVRKTVPVPMNPKAGAIDHFRLLAQISLRKDLLPQRPQIRERTTGELMGEAAARRLLVGRNPVRLEMGQRGRRPVLSRRLRCLHVERRQGRHRGGVCKRILRCPQSRRGAAGRSGRAIHNVFQPIRAKHARREIQRLRVRGAKRRHA
jgi:hypothetical protein